VIRVVSIQFSPAGKMYDFNAGTLDLKPGDKVIVETDRGISLGTVIAGVKEKDELLFLQPLAQVQRLLGSEDEKTLSQHSRLEKEAYSFCLQRIRERCMDMKLVRVEYLFDGSKAIFYFTADGRVDFRELVKDLAHSFHTRIEMRQIGVRDEAKMVGGLGICGRELCCSSFLREFQPVSVKMAKEQNLALNPSKISGQCGRLLCCLDYEYETYCDLRRNFPKQGKKVYTPQYDGTVEKVNLLTGEMLIRLEDGKLATVNAKELLDENVNLTNRKEPLDSKLVAETADLQNETVRTEKQHKPFQQKIPRVAKPNIDDVDLKTPAEDAAVIEPVESTIETSVAAEQQQKSDGKEKRKRRNRRHLHRKPAEKKTGQ